MSTASDNRDWREKLTADYGKAVTGIIEFGKAVFEFKQHCAKKQGGSEFQECLGEWLHMSQSGASKYCTIGERYDKLIQHKNKLPASFSAIYHASYLDDEVIAFKVTPESRASEVEAMRAARLPRKEQLRILGDDSNAELLKSRATALGVDPTLRPYSALSFAIEVAQIEQACGLRNDRAEAFVTDPVDGADVGKHAELTAHRRIVGAPLYHRMLWCAEFGLHPDVLLGVTADCSIEIIVAARRLARDEALRSRVCAFDNLQQALTAIDWARAVLCGASKLRCPPVKADFRTLQERMQAQHREAQPAITAENAPRAAAAKKLQRGAP